MIDTNEIGWVALGLTQYGAGQAIVHDGRPAFVVMPPSRDPAPRSSLVLIRYLDGNRERLLVSEYDCLVNELDEDAAEGRSIAENDAIQAEHRV